MTTEILVVINGWVRRITAADHWLVGVPPDEDHLEAVSALVRLKDDVAFAPTLVWFELRNLLLANECRPRITPIQRTRR